MTPSFDLEMTTRSAMNRQFALWTFTLAAFVFQVQLVSVFVGDWIFLPSYISSWNGSGNEPGLAALGETACCERECESAAVRTAGHCTTAAEMPLVKTVRTDTNGEFDFGVLQEGHYTLVIDWPSEYADWFDVEIKNLPRRTSSVKMCRLYTRTARAVMSSSRLRTREHVFLAKHRRFIN